MRSAECGVRNHRQRRQITNRGFQVLIGERVAFEGEFGVGGGLTGSEANDVAIPDLNRLGVLWLAAVVEIQRGTKGRRILKQQPMIRRNEGDAFVVWQRPCHHLRKAFFVEGLLQGGQKINTCQLAVEMKK